jgi:hypothetical protein
VAAVAEARGGHGGHPAKLAAADDADGAAGGEGDHRSDKKESSSFLKKRTKKLLSVAVSIRVSWLNTRPDATCKSFLLLFFKKEDSSF